jgi:hypothetical protein
MGVPSGPRTEDDHLADVLRRDLLGITAGVMFGASLSGPVSRALEAIPSVDVQVGASDIARLKGERQRIYMAGHMLGGGVLRAKALLDQHARALSLLRGRFVSTEIQAQAHTVVASLGKEIGWDLHDLGLQGKAQQVWMTSLAVARDAEQPFAGVVQAHLLENLAHQAIALGQHQRALDLLAMVSGREHMLPPMQQSHLSSVRAQAAAGLGDVVQTRRCMAFAEDHLEAPTDERDAEWNVNGWYGRAEMDGNFAHALTMLAMKHESMTDDAVRYAAASIRGYPPDEARSQARVKTSLARLHAAHRDVDGMQLAGREAIEAARHLHSPRVVGELIALRPLLKPMTRHAEIAEMDANIRTLSKAVA